MSDLNPPSAPPSFDLEPGDLITEAKELVAATAHVWDQIAQIVPLEATFANTVLPILKDENTRHARERIIGFLESASPLKEVCDASHEATMILQRDNVSRWGRQDVFKAIDSVWQQHLKEEPEMSIDPESLLALWKMREQFLQAGAGLDDPVSISKLKEIVQEKKRLESEYIRNLNSHTGGLWLTVEELEGVPKSYLERWKADGNKRWVDRKVPNISAVLRHAVRPEVRMRVFLSWENMVKESNVPILKEILRLRDEEAHELGYAHYAHATEKYRMMRTGEAVEFLDGLRDDLMELGKRELESLKALKKMQDSTKTNGPLAETFFLWDRQYYTRIEKLTSFKVDQELISEYFPFEQCLERLLSLQGELFGLKFVKYPSHSPGLSTWHPDVLVYTVWNTCVANGEAFLGYIYLDVFPRDHKYSHKGHYTLQPGFTKEDGSRHYPCAAIMANFSPPSATRPSLLKLHEVITCFHELGHSLHNLLAVTQFSRFHGPQVPRDFVEIPSIMLEHLFWNREVIRLISGHYTKLSDAEMKEKLPYDIIDQLIASRFANEGLNSLSNLLLSTFDLKVHTPAGHESLQNLHLPSEFNKDRKNICLMSGPEEAGLGLDAAHGYSRYRFYVGYPATYYTYLLADAFSYDIFETIFRQHLPSAKTTVHGVEDIVTPKLKEEFKRYRRIILQPGGRHLSYLDILRDFLGRNPNADAYLQMLKTVSKERSPLIGKG